MNRPNRSEIEAVEQDNRSEISEGRRSWSPDPVIGGRCVEIKIGGRCVEKEVGRCWKKVARRKNGRIRFIIRSVFCFEKWLEVERPCLCGAEDAQTFH